MKGNSVLRRSAFFVALSATLFPVCFTQSADRSQMMSSSPSSALAPESVRTRQAEVKLEYARWNTLKGGVDCYADSAKYHWMNIPAGLQGARWSMHPMHVATLQFKVTQPGLVFMAVTTRFGKGGYGGDWQQGLIDPIGLEQEGWRPLPEFEGLASNEEVAWTIYYKPCVAGETHTYRTEKYVAPILLMR